jgi:ABC-2 type transport system permease protein
LSELVRRLPAYLQYASMWTQLAFFYRFNLALQVAAVLLQVFLLKMVWTAVYAGRPSVEGLALDDLVAYLTLANLQLWIFLPMAANIIHQRVREGQIALDLARPVGFVGQVVAQQAGATAGILSVTVFGFPIAFLIGGARPPGSVEAALLYVVSLTLAYLIAVAMALLMGLVAFWTLQIDGINVIYRFVNAFFGGALVPLWFFPPTMRTIAELLPFQTQAFIPIGIYLGRIGGAEAARALAVQLFWAVALFALAQVVWRRAFRRVVVQGG